MRNDDLLRPTLSDYQRVPELYNSTGFFLSAFFGGPMGAAIYGGANSHRLNRLHTDLPLLVVVVAAGSAVAGSRGGETHGGGWSGGSYHQTHGKSFSGGYYYHGREHSHWTYWGYSNRYGCTCYWDPSTSCYYYWCPSASCYYPVSYFAQAPVTPVAVESAAA